MAKIIALVNQKGGVAKTTTANALAFGLVRSGKKVLLIDMDPQGNLTNSCGLEVDGEYPPVLKFLKIIPNVCFEGPVPITDKLDLIGSSIGLETANIILGGKPCREQYLKRAIDSYKNKYDYIIIDSNPSLSVITLNVLAACEEIIVPFKPEFNSESGVAMLLDTIEDMKFINHDLKIRGFLVTMVDSRRKSTQSGIAYIKEKAEKCNSKVYDATIRMSVYAADAPKVGLSLYDYKGDSNVAKDYAAFVNEFLNEEV